MQSRIRDLITQAEAGRAGAPEELFASLYLELHRLADVQLRRLGPQMSLGTTTLLHEAYLDLARREGLRFPDESRFLSYAARAMPHWGGQAFAAAALAPYAGEAMSSCFSELDTSRHAVVSWT